MLMLLRLSTRSFSAATLALALIDPIPSAAWATFRRWAEARKLLLSFHYYAPPTACRGTLKDR